MGVFAGIFKPVVAAIAVAALLSGAAAAQQEVDLDALYAELADPDTRDWESVERRIAGEWARSGSASMDLLLQRGREALEGEDYVAAIEHLTALTDHAPDFAEGWNARATAFFHRNQYGPALADIRRTLALNPRHFGALTGLAIILQELGYPEDALAAWREVEKLNPHRPETRDAIRMLEIQVEGRTL